MTSTATPKQPSSHAKVSALPGAFELCRTITERHGHTYALATRLMNARQRNAVWSLYAWSRIVDDYVDLESGEKKPVADAAAVEKQVRELHAAFLQAVTTGELDDALSANDRAIISAVAQTYVDWGIDTQLCTDFVESMLMDVPGASKHVAHFATWEQLDQYMWGSAAVVGLQMLPIIGVRKGLPPEQAEGFAAELGRAFQVTNFLRDVKEDLGRGRIYLPAEQWSAFGVDVERLHWCARNSCTDGQVRQAIAYFIACNRAMYRSARPGIDMLRGPGRHAVAAANTLYSDILTEIEKADYNIFARRAVVPQRRRAKIAVCQGFGALFC